VASPSGDERPAYPPEDEDWEHKQIGQIVGCYPRRFSDELAAELQFTLFEIKRDPPAGIRNWKAYVATALRNAAVDFINEQRRLEQREIAMAEPEIVRPSTPLELAIGKERSAGRQLAEIRRVLRPQAYRLLTRYAANRNQSRLADEFGVHRNTIRRRLRRIWANLRRCPIENVTTLEREGLRRLAYAANESSRQAFRAKVVLALVEGKPLRTVAREFHTSRPTISRWKRRFQKQGIDGLKALHRGRQRDRTVRTRLTHWFRRHRRKWQGGPSPTYRAIARALGLSKSTVYRILRECKVAPR
jgi:transposase